MARDPELAPEGDRFLQNITSPSNISHPVGSILSLTSSLFQIPFQACYVQSAIIAVAVKQKHFTFSFYPERRIENKAKRKKHNHWYIFAHITYIFLVRNVNQSGKHSSL